LQQQLQRAPPQIGQGQPRAPIFPKLNPGLNKRLGDLLKKANGGDKQEKAEPGKRPILKRLYKRETQDMADLEMASVIQVLSPSDVAGFKLGEGNQTDLVVTNSAEWDPNNICMSLTSLIGGLVMLLGVLFVASMVASFMHCQMRKRRVKKIPQ